MVGFEYLYLYLSKDSHTRFLSASTSRHQQVSGFGVCGWIGSDHRMGWSSDGFCFSLCSIFVFAFPLDRNNPIQERWKVLIDSRTDLISYMLAGLWRLFWCFVLFFSSPISSDFGSFTHTLCEEAGRCPSQFLKMKLDPFCGKMNMSKFFLFQNQKSWQ